MLRPTLAEMLAGIQRATFETLIPELRSPYAQSQAATAAGVLGYVAASLEAIAAYDKAELDDLKSTLEAIAKEASGETPEAQKRTLGGGGPERRAMEAAIAELAQRLVLGKLAAPTAETVRGYIRRHLDRMRTLLAPGLPARG